MADPWLPERTLVRRAGLVLAIVLLGAAGCTAERNPQGDALTAEARVAAAVQEVLDGDRAFDGVRAVIATVDGETVFERYYNTSAEAYRPIQSVTKTVVATLVGIAVDQRLLSLEQPLADLLPSYRGSMPPRLRQVTLEQVLTMTGGFPPESPRDVRITAEAADPVTATFGLWTRDVGRHVYSNVGANLLSAILVEATGESVLDYARHELFGPLGIDSQPAHEPRARPEALEEYLAADFAWPVDGHGRHLAWAYLKLTPRDLVTLGQLHLGDGEWNGEQIVSRQWVDAATSRHVEAPDGVLPGYGYMWWVGVLDNAPAAVAWGHGGQAVAVVPSKDLVVVVSSDFDVDGATDRELTPDLTKGLVVDGVMRNLDP